MLMNILETTKRRAVSGEIVARRFAYHGRKMPRILEVRNVAPTATPHWMTREWLEKYVADAYKGLNKDVNVDAARDVAEAERMIIAAIEPKLPRRLSVVERNRVGMEVIVAWNRRHEQLNAALADTQAALHRPLCTMGAR